MPLNSPFDDSVEMSSGGFRNDIGVLLENNAYHLHSMPPGKTAYYKSKHRILVKLKQPAWFRVIAQGIRICTVVPGRAGVGFASRF